MRRKLTRAALEYLRARGIDARAAAKRKLRMLDGLEAFKTFALKRSFLVIPYYTAKGQPLLNRHAPFVRGRLLGGEGFLAGIPTKQKFRQPSETGNHIYLDPARKDWRELLADPTRPLVITEGEVKAMCATEHGIACLAVGGVWSWRTKVNGRGVPLPEFDQVAWSGRLVLLAWDSDTDQKPDVLAALRALTLELTTRGAKVERIKIPPADGGGKVGLDDYLVAHGAKAFEGLDREPVVLVLDPGNPPPAARAFVASAFMDTDGERLLLRHQDDFYLHAGTAYERIEDELIRAKLYGFLEDAQQPAKKSEPVPFRASKTRVDQVLDALKSATYLAASRPPPCWLDERPDPAPVDLIPMANGLLHVPTRKLLVPDSRLFVTNPLQFAYDPKAPKPEAWLKFLDELFGKDKEAVTALQEFAGYLLTPDTSQQKILLIVGPKRSGKGTIGHVLEALVGLKNTVHPMLAQFGQPFGLECLIGKSLAIIADARLGGRADLSAVTERLLSISGGDGQTVPRKYKGDWDGPLPIRFAILTNEIPRFTDASGALPSRLVPLTLSKSFYGHEDLELKSRLYAELPGIFCWALDGFKTLRERGYFIVPRSSTDVMHALEDLASPVAAFVRERCVVGPEHSIQVDILYAAWKAWSEGQGHKVVKIAEVFGRDLHAACPTVRRAKLRVKGPGSTKDRVRKPHHVGIALRTTAMEAKLDGRRPLPGGAAASAPEDEEEGGNEG